MAHQQTEGDNATNVEDCVVKLQSNSQVLTDVNLNNMKRLPVPVIQRLLMVLPESSYVLHLSMANTNLNDAAAEPLITALEKNCSLASLNVETNFLSGSFLVRLFRALLVNQTVTEVKVANQGVTVSNEQELDIASAVCENLALTRVGYSFRNSESRFRVNETLMKNVERRRILRKLERDAKAEGKDLNEYLEVHAPKESSRDRLSPSPNPDGRSRSVGHVSEEEKLVKCDLPPQKSVGGAGENDTNVLECVAKLKANDPTLLDVNCNNLKRTPLPDIRKLLEAVPNSMHLQKLSLVNLDLDDKGLAPLLESVKGSKSLKSLNVETNNLSGGFLLTLVEALEVTQSIEQLRMGNQRAPALDHAGEQQVVILLRRNFSITRLGYQFRSKEYRTKVDEVLSRNMERKRLNRQYEKANGAG